MKQIESYKEKCVYTFANGDILIFEYSCGTFASIGELGYYQISYGKMDTELFNDADKPGYTMCQTEYYPVDLLDLARASFVIRLMSKEPHKSVGGYSLEEIKAHYVSLSNANNVRLQEAWNARMQKHAEGDKLFAEGNLVWDNAVLALPGSITMEWKADGNCVLSTGEVFVNTNQ